MDLSKQDAHPDEAERLPLQVQALELRKQGYSYREIGRAIRRHHTVARDYVVDALREMRADVSVKAEELRELEALRLDEVWRRLFPKGSTITPDVARALVRVSESRRVLLGLNAPPQLAGGSGGVPYVGAFDESRLSVDELLAYELLIMKATGGLTDPAPHEAQAIAAPAFLDPEDEVFPEVEAPAPVTDPGPAAPSLPAWPVP